MQINTVHKIPYIFINFNATLLYGICSVHGRENDLVKLDEMPEYKPQAKKDPPQPETKKRARQLKRKLLQKQNKKRKIK